MPWGQPNPMYKTGFPIIQAAFIRARYFCFRYAEQVKCQGEDTGLLRPPLETGNTIIFQQVYRRIASFLVASLISTDSRTMRPRTRIMSASGLCHNSFANLQAEVTSDSVEQVSKVSNSWRGLHLLHLRLLLGMRWLALLWLLQVAHQDIQYSFTATFLPAKCHYCRRRWSSPFDCHSGSSGDIGPAISYRNARYHSRAWRVREVVVKLILTNLIPNSTLLRVPHVIRRVYLSSVHSSSRPARKCTGWLVPLLFNPAISARDDIFCKRNKKALLLHLKCGFVQKCQTSTMSCSGDVITPPVTPSKIRRGIRTRRKTGSECRPMVKNKIVAIRCQYHSFWVTLMSNHRDRKSIRYYYTYHHKEK